MKKEMKIVLPFYKIAYAVSFVVILSLIRGVVFTNEIGLSIEAPFAILTAVFCADTYVQEITSKRSEIHRLYPIRKRICSIMQRIMIQEFFLLLLAVLGYGLFFVFQKPVTHPATESEILQFIAYFLAIVVTIFFWGILVNTLSMLFRNMWMGIGSCLLIWVATNSTGGDKLFGAWNLFSYAFRDIENTADVTWLQGKALCMLSQIDENDLSEFLDKDSTAAVVTPQPDTSKVVLDETNNEDVDKEATVDPEKTSSAKTNMGAMATILILALGGVAAYYYFKIYKPKKEEDEDDQPEGLETGGLEEVPDEEESEDEDFEENEK